MIYVTRPYIPPRDKYVRYVDKVLASGQLSNNGPMVRELQDRLEEYLGVRNLVLTCNGTQALHVAYRVLGVQGRVVTTPFSFVASTSSLAWDGLTPVFCDIHPETYNLDPRLLPDVDCRGASAILPVHVFGNPCDADLIESFASSHGLKVVFDAAHAFGVDVAGSSVLLRGDASVLSFHATKIFHTLEGGALILKDPAQVEEATRAITFGYQHGEVVSIGTNAKMSELQAAMGLCVLDDMHLIQEELAAIDDYYTVRLQNHVQLQRWADSATRNHAYFPIVLSSSFERESVERRLSASGVVARRYFAPSLNTLPYLQDPQICPTSESIADRILCLPSYVGLQRSELEMIANAVLSALYEEVS